MIENNNTIEYLDKNKLIGITIFTFLLVLLFKDFFLLKPLFYYVTTVHEVCHALATLLTGGVVKEIDLYSTGGHAVSAGGFFPLISIAGYVGTTIIGSLFLIFSQKEKHIDIFLIIFSFIMIVLSFIYIESYFNIFFISSLLISIFLIISIKLNFTKYIGIFLGNLFILDSFSDMKVYLFSFFKSSDIIYQTDAGILARYIGFEFLTLPIALSIFLINIFILYKTLKILINK